jgi:hypothetical protein
LEVSGTHTELLETTLTRSSGMTLMQSPLRTVPSTSNSTCSRTMV